MTRLLAAIAALLLAVPAFAAEPAEPGASDAQRPEGEAPLAAVRVEGNRRVEADAVRNALKTKAGMVFEPRRANDELRAVWRLGFFSDVQLALDETDPTKPVLVVRVVEKPAIREIKIRGNKELSDEDLKDTVDIKAFSILDMAAVRRNAKKVQDKYVEKGYFLAEVTPNVEKLEGNEVNVWLDVNEHAKVQIKRITFVGNKKVPDEDLKGAMQTEEGGFLSFITSSGTYREEVFQRDLAMIQGVYYDRGFIHVRVGQPQVSLSADKRLIYITIPLTEGEQYAIGKVDFSGDLIKAKPELHAKMSVHPGELFNRSKLQRDILAFTELYYDAGYAYANITPQTAVDPDKKLVDLIFDVQKGEKIFIEKIEISGNHKTRDKVIRRELRVYEGELFSGSGLRESRQRVTALGFFETVDITHKRGSSDNQVVVSVVVKEKPTGTFQLGLGVSSVESFLLTAQVSQNNALGWGVTASLAAQISSLRSLVQFSYLDPYFFDTQWIFSFNYFRQTLDYFGFIRNSNGGDLTFGYHITPDLMLHLGYAAEQVALQSAQAALLPDLFSNGISSALKLTLNYDRRDNRLFPTSGHFESASVEYSPTWLGATAHYNFARLLANVRFYQPIPLGLVFKAQGQVGYIASKDVISISERFFAGGINTLRGYALRSVAPTLSTPDSLAPDATTSEFAVGGNKQLIFNFELEFPIFEKVGIRGVVFYDVGNVYAEGQPFFSQTGKKPTPLGMLHSVGIGFRWFSPIGPLRFEWGFPLTRRGPTTGFQGDDPYLFEFTIGNFF